MTDWTPCVVESCRPIKTSHLPECPQAGCRGCAPRLAEPGQIVCTNCRLRAGDRLEALGLRHEYRTDDRYEERDPVTGDVIARHVRHLEPRWMPSLYNAVLTPAKVPSQGGGGKSSDLTTDDTQVIERSSPQQQREAIRRMLVTWCKVLEEDYGIGLPAKPAVRLHLHQAHAHHLRLWERVPARVIDQSVPAMTRHVLARLPALLATEHADQLVHDIDTTWRDAQRCAYPSPPLGQALGECPDCGTVVRAAELHGWVACRGCGTVRTLDEWQAVIVGDLSREKSAEAGGLIAWLTYVHRRQITPTALRLWVSKGVKVDGETVKLRRMGTDPETSRALYSVADASRIAAALYGPARVSV